MYSSLKNTAYSEITYISICTKAIDKIFGARSLPLPKANKVNLVFFSVKRREQLPSIGEAFSLEIPWKVKNAKRSKYVVKKNRGPSLRSIAINIGILFINHSNSKLTTTASWLTAFSRA